MDVAALLVEIYDRIPPLVRESVSDLAVDQLTWSPTDRTNTIGWLGWHIARVQDHQIAELVPTSQLWIEDDWARRFGLDADPSNMGYGHDRDDVLAVRPESPDAIVEYVEAVAARTRAYISTLTPDDLDRVVDDAWDPPVTLGVRLVSVADDCLQHAGQVAYLRGLLDG
jgi:hypothetical protein